MKTQFRHTAVLSLAVLCLAYVHSQEYQDGYGGGGGGGGGYDYNNGYDDSGGGGGGDVDRQYTSTYGQDTLFEDYAEGKIRKVEGGGGGVLPAAVTTIVGWFVGGKIHSGKAISKLKRKHQREQKDLYTTYYNDIYKLQLQNAELSKTVNTLQNAVRELEERIQLVRKYHVKQKTVKTYLCLELCFIVLNFDIFVVFRNRYNAIMTNLSSQISTVMI